MVTPYRKARLIRKSLRVFCWLFDLPFWLGFAASTVLLFLSISNAHAAAGYGYKGACYETSAIAMSHAMYDTPFVDSDYWYKYTSHVAQADDHFVDVTYRRQNLTSGAVNTVTLTLTFYGCALWTQPDQTTLGSRAQGCVAAGICSNQDVVQAQLITQDTIIYGVAVLLFFFGFHVGMQIMLGAIRGPSE